MIYIYIYDDNIYVYMIDMRITLMIVIIIDVMIHMIIDMMKGMQRNVTVLCNDMYDV